MQATQSITLWGVSKVVTGGVEEMTKSKGCVELGGVDGRARGA